MFQTPLCLLVGILLGCAVVIARTDVDFGPQCPQGFYPGIAVTEGQFTVPFKRMYNLTGSFFHAEWYTQTNTTNQGEDNTVGSIRSGVLGGAEFEERLVRVFRDDGEAMIAYVTQIPVEFPNPSGGKLVSYSSYLEELRLISICQDTATLVHFWVAYCADDAVGGWDTWLRVRDAALNAVIVGEGAQEFEGTCPV